MFFLQMGDGQLLIQNNLHLLKLHDQLILSIFSNSFRFRSQLYEYLLELLPIEIEFCKSLQLFLLVRIWLDGSL